MNHRPSTVLGEATLADLRAAVAGEVITPGEAHYDVARQVWNGAIDRHPAVIARCTGTADVVTTLEFARSEGLPLAVRGGGHNVAGFGTCDNGLVLDLSPMKGVRVDTAARTVRAQGGVLWGELDRETQAFGSATTGGLVTTTGIAGFTLGGGIGWLMRRHGLAADNLLSADVVTADGAVMTTSFDSDPELLWALRGGGETSASSPPSSTPCTRSGPRSSAGRCSTPPRRLGICYGSTSTGPATCPTSSPP
jgi:FAD/FMN-containing dehydrogenase